MTAGTVMGQAAYQASPRIVVALERHQQRSAARDQGQCKERSPHGSE